MNAIFPILIGITLLAVAGVMLMGVISMIKGGEFNKKHGNKIMQWRVYLQALAIGLLALAYYMSQS